MKMAAMLNAFPVSGTVSNPAGAVASAQSRKNKINMILSTPKAILYSAK